MLSEMHPKRWKVPSGELTNTPYLRKLASFAHPIIVSTGMAKLSEIEHAVDVLLDAGLKRDMITLLHCTTEYPAPIAEVNLLAMKSMASAFQLPVGYSDHTDGIAVSLAAVALGAVVVEKHFTLIDNWKVQIMLPVLNLLNYARWCWAFVTFRWLGQA